MVVSVLRRVPLYQEIYTIIRDRITSGVLEPGGAVDVQGLADELGVSRTPVREAVRQLVQVGLLEEVGSGRARVCAPSVSALAELYQVRAALESVATETASYVAGPGDVGRLRKICQQGLTARDEDDWQGVVESNAQFHEVLMEIAGNDTARRMLDAPRILVARHRVLAMQFDARRQSALDAHANIVEAIDHGMHEIARKEMFVHVISAGVWAVEHLRGEDGVETPAMQYLKRSAAGRQ